MKVSVKPDNIENHQRAECQAILTVHENTYPLKEPDLSILKPIGIISRGEAIPYTIEIMI